MLEKKEGKKMSYGMYITGKKIVGKSTGKSATAEATELVNRFDWLDERCD